MPMSSVAASLFETRSASRRTRTKMTMRINDLIRINILALSAMPASARGSGLDFGLGHVGALRLRHAQAALARGVP